MAHAHHNRARRLLIGVLAALASSALIAAPAARADTPLAPFIIGGQQSGISQFPWQVFIAGEIEPGFAVTCGGAILDATHILTAAHCVDHEGTTTPYPAATFNVLAGASEVSGYLTGMPPIGSQVANVTSLRTHPYYAALPETRDDVAVLTLATPLELSPAANAQPIALVASGATPPAGTALTISGYGRESGAEGSIPDGKLHATTLTAVSSPACSALLGVNSAVLLCAQGATSATCQGDSGGPLTEGAPAVEVGIVDFGLRECPVNTPDAFTNLAAPEVRAFIEGSEAPPLAARESTPPELKAPALPAVDYSPLTCEPGSWSGAPAFSYAFELENAAQTVLQSGPGNVYIPQSNIVGSSIVCVVEASNAGGVSTARSSPTPPVLNDGSPPSAAFSGAARCHLRACTLAIKAADPNSVALSVHASASYAVVTSCPKSRRRRFPHAVCHKTRTVTLASAAIAAGLYRAVAGGLPYGEAIKFSVRASNAAALTQRTAAVLSTTLRKPKPKPKQRRR